MKVLDKISAETGGKTSVHWHERILISYKSEFLSATGLSGDNKCEDWKKTYTWILFFADSIQLTKKRVCRLSKYGDK